MRILSQLNQHRIAAIALAAIFLSVLAYAVFAPVGGNAGAVTVEVKEGQGLKAIARLLADSGLIRSRILFEGFVVLTGRQSHLQAGTYIFSRSQNIPQIAHALSAGLAESTDIEVVIPEGSNIWETASRLKVSGLVKDPASFVSRNVQSEGRLFPETYRFAKDSNESDIVKRLRDEFDRSPCKLPQNQLIVASMLEKEAKTERDMGLVAGIIKKRMDNNIPLQIDATVAYGWCLKELKRRPDRLCDVTQAPIANEIKLDGPYNTYARNGLPAGPISNPGAQACRAAANPQDSPYLYYLSTRDGSQLIYSKTLQEHLANRKKYLGF